MQESDDFVDNVEVTAPPNSQEEDKKEVDDADPAPDVEKAVVPYDAIQNSKKSCWSDERGNLKVVNLVVRNPCKIFWLIIVIVMALTFMLNVSYLTNGCPAIEWYFSHFTRWHSNKRNITFLRHNLS